MGDPLKDGKATTAHITIKGTPPAAFTKAFEETTWTPSLCKGLENVYGMSQEKINERREKMASSKITCGMPDNGFTYEKEQKVGERRHPDCVNWSEAGFHKSSNGIDWDRKQPMGMGEHPFAHPTAVIPRVFRFTVETDLNTKFQYFVKDLEILWKAKHIRASLYETADFECDEVLSAYSSQKCHQPLTIIMYDGMGAPLMAYRFHDVAVHSYSTPLAYASSDVLTNKVVFTYKSVERLRRPKKTE
jgi:hypothetical protein